MLNKIRFLFHVKKKTMAHGIKT